MALYKKNQNYRKLSNIHFLPVNFTFYVELDNVSNEYTDIFLSYLNSSVQWNQYLGNVYSTLLFTVHMIQLMCHFVEGLSD